MNIYIRNRQGEEYAVDDDIARAEVEIANGEKTWSIKLLGQVDEVIDEDGNRSEHLLLGFISNDDGEIKGLNIIDGEIHLLDVIRIPLEY